jgi:hypothetical protein
MRDIHRQEIYRCYGLIRHQGCATHVDRDRKYDAGENLSARIHAATAAMKKDIGSSLAKSRGVDS